MARSIECKCENGFTCGYCLRNAKPWHFTPSKGSFEMKRNPKRERWMALFESTVISLEPRFAGHIPWDAASFHFNEGTSPGLAAFRVIKSEQPTGATVRAADDAEDHRNEEDAK